MAAKINPQYLFPLKVWNGGATDLTGDPLQYGPIDETEPTGWDERQGFAELQILAPDSGGGMADMGTQIISGSNGHEIIGCEGDDSDVIAGLDLRTASLGLAGLGVVYVLYRMMRHPATGAVVSVPQIVPPGTPGAVAVPASSIPAAAIPTPPNLGQLPDTVMNGEKLNVNDTRRSPLGNYTLVMQGDGNLVLYRTTGGKPLSAVAASDAIWSTSTYDNVTKFAWMQPDGNFVLYTGDMRATWASNTNTGEPNFVRVNDNGTLSMHTPGGNVIWMVGTQTVAPITSDAERNDPEAAARQVAATAAAAAAQRGIAAAQAQAQAAAAAAAQRAAMGVHGVPTIGGTVATIAKAPVAFAGGLASSALHTAGNVFHTISGALGGGHAHKRRQQGQARRR